MDGIRCWHYFRVCGDLPDGTTRIRATHWHDGQVRVLLDHVENASVKYICTEANVGFAPKAIHPLHGLKVMRWAMCGRLRVGKENLHVAGLVGAAMCSACLRGTHDRWP